MSILTLTNIGLRYQTGADVLRGLNHSFVPGSFTFLTGASGAGKSSLLKLCYLAENPSSGNISLFGKDPTKLSRDARAKLRRRIGVVFQDFRLIPHLTAVENVMLPLMLRSAKKKAAADHARHLLRWSGALDQEDVYPDQLSGGQQQRVAIARAVIGRPNLLLADEPTGNVDDASAEKIMHLFLELHKLGTTVVVATHNLSLIESHGFPCLRLSGGQLLSVATNQRAAA
ncbi:MAG: ATP-binding cassette domain-containing protein [Alphaproteobacteria bacterium]|nr:ATP-binding cassette domain-containing protein [Alphaproteobacteria bacterium]